MVSNSRTIAKGLADVSARRFRTLLAQKAAWYGTRIVIVDRFFASSKTCSGCGSVKDELSLADRTYRCDSCGLSMDRDDNATLSLARWTPETAKRTKQPVLVGVGLF